MKHIRTKPYQEISKASKSTQSLTSLCKPSHSGIQLSLVDLPPLSMYEAADFTQKPKIGSFWHAAERKLMDGHLSIPCSNANSKRGFYMMRKLHTDQSQVLINQQSSP